MAKSLNGNSADGAGAELGALVGDDLVAVVEVLTPGPGLGAGVRLARPIPGSLKLALQFLEEQQLGGARGQRGLLLGGPGLGLLPGEIVGVTRQQDQRDRPFILERQSGIDAVVKGRAYRGKARDGRGNLRWRDRARLARGSPAGDAFFLRSLPGFCHDDPQWMNG